MRARRLKGLFRIATSLEALTLSYSISLINLMYRFPLAINLFARHNNTTCLTNTHAGLSYSTYKADALKALGEEG